MRLFLTICAFLALGLTILTGCQKASEPVKVEKPQNSAVPETIDEAAHTDNAPRITLADAKKDFDAGNVVFVDTRAAVQYQTEHIKGAINVPAEAIDVKYKEIPTGKKIIAYCS